MCSMFVVLPCLCQEAIEGGRVSPALKDSLRCAPARLGSVVPPSIAGGRPQRARSSVRVMTILYHEKQEAALCGQHCLNNLLQGPYFNAGALADIAHELDRKEQALMMSEGMTADAIAFMREASGNVDAQGNFSIQVLSEALKRSFGLELSDVRHEEVRPLMREPAKAEGFVINRHAHWLGLG